MNSREIATAAFTIALVATVIGIVFWPLRHASPFGDDFLYIMLGRHLDSPAPMLMRDVVGSYFFRPVVMGMWWAVSHLSNGHVALQYAFNGAVHGLNGVLLYALLRYMGTGWLAATVAAVAFVAHPTPFAASSWLADRFDLCTTAFGLGLLLAVERYLARPSPSGFSVAMAAALATLLSKETGLAIVFASGILLAMPRPEQAASRRQAVRLAAGLCAAIAVALFVRSLAIGSHAESVLFEGGIAATALGGVARWAAELPGFLQPDIGPRAAGIVASLAALAWIAPAASRRGLACLLERGSLRVILLGAAILVAAAAVQSPILNALRFRALYPSFDFASLAACRFYYVPLAGVALVVGAFVDVARRAPQPRGMTAIVAVASVAVLLASLVTSATIARDWAWQSRGDGGRDAIAAARAVEAIPTFPPACKIYLLDVPRSAFENVSDTAVKSILPPGHPGISCFVQTERSPWYNVVPRGIAPGPLLPTSIEGHEVAPLPIGSLAIHYLRIPGTTAASADPGAIFLALRDRKFSDVTAEVRSGQRKIRFFDERPNL